jgi:2-oxoglutarate ferredoxin oxidoreductase subunit gamma
VSEISNEFKKAIGVIATQLAEEKLGRSLYANIIMLGALAAATGFVSLSALRKALEGNVPVNTLAKNLKALEYGYMSVATLADNKR